MTKEEMKLEPLCYFFLQYFRQHEKPYYTILRIVNATGISKHTVRRAIDKLRKLDIIDFEVTNNFYEKSTVIKIELKGKWKCTKSLNIPTENSTQWTCPDMLH